MVNGEIHVFWNVFALILSMITFVVAFFLHKNHKYLKAFLFTLSLGIIIVDAYYLFTGKWLLVHWLLNVLGMLGGILTVLYVAHEVKEKELVYHKFYLLIWGIIAILIDGYYVMAMWL